MNIKDSHGTAGAGLSSKMPNTAATAHRLAQLFWLRSQSCKRNICQGCRDANTLEEVNLSTVDKSENCSFSNRSKSRCPEPQPPHVSSRETGAWLQSGPNARAACYSYH